MRAFRFCLIALCAIALHAPSEARQQDGESAETLELFAIIYRAGPAWLEGRPMQEQPLRPHAIYWTRLFEGGRIHAAGPWGGDGGLVLLYAPDLAAAERIVAEDPAVTAGLFIGEVRPYAPVFLREEPLTRRRD